MLPMWPQEGEKALLLLSVCPAESLGLELEGALTTKYSKCKLGSLPGHTNTL